VRLYLAGKYRWRLVLVAIAERLTHSGHIVNARWLTGTHVGDCHNARWAQEDLDDIDSVEQLILFQLPCDNPEESSGRQIEYGYALARGKQVVIVGGRTVVFHYLDHVTHFPSIEAFYMAYLNKEEDTR